MLSISFTRVQRHREQEEHLRMCEIINQLRRYHLWWIAFNFRDRCFFFFDSKKKKLFQNFSTFARLTTKLFFSLFFGGPPNCSLSWVFISFLRRCRIGNSKPNGHEHVKAPLEIMEIFIQQQHRPRRIHVMTQPKWKQTKIDLSLALSAWAFACHQLSQMFTLMRFSPNHSQWLSPPLSNQTMRCCAVRTKENF